MRLCFDRPPGLCFDCPALGLVLPRKRAATKRLQGAIVRQLYTVCIVTCATTRRAALSDTSLMTAWTYELPLCIHCLIADSNSGFLRV